MDQLIFICRDQFSSTLTDGGFVLFEHQSAVRIRPLSLSHQGLYSAEFEFLGKDLKSYKSEAQFM